MASTRVKLNSGEIQKYLDGGNGMSEVLHDRAAKVLAAAKAMAPVDTGAYRNGLHVEEAHTDRLGVHVAGGTDHDWIVEARHGVLAKALDAAGGS